MPGPFNTFTGSTVAPGQVAYESFDLTESITLTWPNFTGEGEDVYAVIMDIDADNTGYSITMPDASQVGTGTTALFRNVGSNLVTIKAADGSTIGTVAAGVAYFIYLQDNATAAGSWGVVTFGTGTSAADASLLAGYGLLAISTTLNAAYETVPTNASTRTIATTDRASSITFTGGNSTVTLPTAASMGSDFFFIGKNGGSGTITYDASGSDTVDGAASVSHAPGEGAFFFSDGISAWYSVGQGRFVNFAFTQLVKSVAGNSNVTLTSAECANKIMQFTGLLTGNVEVYVTNTVSVYYVFNNTTGPYTLTVKTVAGTGEAVDQGTRQILLCDATNVYNAVDSITLTGVFGSGSVGAPSITFSADTSTGMYRPGASQVGITAGGVDAMRFQTATSGVNYLNVTPAATAASPTLAAAGADTNIALTLSGKGTGALNLGQATSTGLVLVADQPVLDSSSNEYLKFTKAASAVNEITLGNAATGSGPTLTATGGDTNIPVTLAGKGTGSVKIGQATSTGVTLVADQPILDSSGNELIKFTKAASAVNEITVANAATAGSPTISATGGDTNITLTLMGKGSGSVRFLDATAPTKIALFDMTVITAGQTRTITIPDVSGRIVTTSGASTANRVGHFSGTTSQLTSTNGFTFDGTTLAVPNGLTVTGASGLLTVTAGGVLVTAGGVTISTLTSGRLPLVSTAGLLADSAAITYSVGAATNQISVLASGSSINNLLCENTHATGEARITAVSTQGGTADFIASSSTADAAYFATGATWARYVAETTGAADAQMSLLTDSGGSAKVWAFGIDSSVGTDLVFTPDASGILGTGNVVAITTAGAMTIASTITTGAPTGGAGAWKLGIANAVSPTSPNRTLTVDIGGTAYYIHAKTTNN